MKKCFYCEREILPSEESSAMKNKKTNFTVYFHYPDCYVRFTTFYKTEKELNKLRKNGYIKLM